MKRSPGSVIFDSLNVVILGSLAIIALYPFWSVIVTSVSDAQEYYRKPFMLWPADASISAYLYIFSTDWIGNGFKITFFVMIVGTLWDMFLVSTAAYGLYKKTLPGRKIITTYFLITFFFSGGLIPYYIVVVKFLGLRNTLAAITITSGLNVWSFIILRTFFKTVPESLTEAARQDGANEFTILFRIMIPLSIPAVATLALFSAVGHWNAWTKALYFISEPYKYPLQMILRRMVIDEARSGVARLQQAAMQKAHQRLMGGTDQILFPEAIKAATICVAMIPVIVIYPFIQRFFVKGIMVGSLKD